MKPRLFVGSSAERLDVANAIQENLERDAEVTVWTQGVFELSKNTLENLVELLDSVDFGVFVFAPDDTARMRDANHKVARDNVVFELGLFVGHLGRQRAFVILPRDVADLHLPTDLLGITPGTYEANRTDGNLVAALGPASHRVRTAMQRTGRIDEKESAASTIPEPQHLDEMDCLSLLESWIGSRQGGENTRTMRFADVDVELGLPPGSAAKHLAAAGERWGYKVVRRGATTILFGG